MFHYFVAKKIETLLLNIISQQAYYLTKGAGSESKKAKLNNEAKQKFVADIRNSLEAVMAKTSPDIYARYVVHRERSTREFDNPFIELYYDTYIAFLKKPPKNPRVTSFLNRCKHLLNQYFPDGYTEGSLY
jgi:hypothetical protein